jgi:Transposase, Mutator family
LISRVTDAVLDDVRSWQSQPLEDVYPVLFLDALIVKVRDGGAAHNPRLLRRELQRRAALLSFKSTSENDYADPAYTESRTSQATTPSFRQTLHSDQYRRPLAEVADGATNARARQAYI